MIELGWFHWLLILSGVKYAAIGAFLFWRYKRRVTEETEPCSPS